MTMTSKDNFKTITFSNRNVFIPACMAHTVLTHRDWKRVEVNSVYLPRALKCWESGGIVGESNSIQSRYLQLLIKTVSNFCLS